MPLIKFVSYLIVFISAVFSSLALSVNFENLSREQQFNSFVQQTLEPFWQQHAKERSFLNKEGLEIHFVQVEAENPKSTVVVSPGRVEGYLKYKELVFDLVQQGHSVYVIDHQGQGYSSRLLENPHKGHVNEYDDYVADLHQLIEQHIKPNESGDLLLLCHSMGGAIGLRYIETYPEQFKKAVFSSPMWGLDSSPIPKPFAKGFVSSLGWVDSLMSEQSSYFVGSKDYEPPSFEDNVLTHSQSRYQYFRDTYEQHPEIKLGGFTFKWLTASIKAIEQGYEELSKVSIPILVLQAGGDVVIDNAGQDMFCQRLAELGNQCHPQQPVVIPNAKHELLIESDEIRNQVLNKIMAFLSES